MTQRGLFTGLFVTIVVAWLIVLSGKLYLLQTHDLVGVGWSEKDVISRLGPPTWTYAKNDPRQPPYVDGFVPDQAEYAKLSVFTTRLVFVFVYFNDQGRVTAYYIKAS